MLAYLTWNLDPVLVRLGPLQIRYYGVTFALTILVAFAVWQWQMHRGGYARPIIDRFLVWGVAATLVGARLGHCLFYEPERYLGDPVRILFIWEGGLASHGATIGLLLALFIFARRNHLRPLELMDRFAFCACIGVMGIRLANFLNSEIVGRAASVAWAVQFPRHELGEAAATNPVAEQLLEQNATSVANVTAHGIPVPARHPSQVYELLLGASALLTLWLADRLAGRERRPLGLLTGLFLAIYFGGRFFLEFFKEYQTTWEGYWTAGQFLSVLPAVGGAALVAWSLWRRRLTNAKA